MKTLLLFVTITAVCWVATAEKKPERNCQVSIFPVHIQSGNQCYFGEVAVGFDHVENKIACGRVNVECN